ncbi:hypothetical protein ASPZODRAFT_1444603 [Penicilliopsis zonata CBS 506.65]|uniref:Secreted protein n=1 Tax=Penicilliopsis zonata CBS 506.65 TaxID=1073090 RepID=A0A1L9SQC7_9EURO|nr:hypothetical protein ASPZODRAFT_1444603 [Penicilliopsis zonata CBS 506.65]OJJ49284.1 hypothetical protein ASPZODRAFT_1444603 [Penicilliopsis zonata CBS 506.65]
MAGGVERAATLAWLLDLCSALLQTKKTWLGFSRTRLVPTANDDTGRTLLNTDFSTSPPHPCRSNSGQTRTTILKGFFHSCRRGALWGGGHQVEAPVPSMGSKRPSPNPGVDDAHFLNRASHRAGI